MTPAKRLLLWAAALGDKVRERVDRRVCRWVEDTKGPDE